MWSLLYSIQWLLLSYDLNSKLFLVQLKLPLGPHSTLLLADGVTLTTVVLFFY